jgi:prepilin-type N-terminal cleavage/methylation domain-containing protein
MKLSYTINRKGFSLVELMIVVVIIGALVAIILPQFNMSESEAKDAGCDASNYGTLRQLTSFRSINGVYPSRLHTGFETAALSSAMGTTEGATALAEVTLSNLVTHTETVSLNADQAKSLADGGLVYLANGGFGIEPEFQVVTNSVSVCAVNANWYEDAHEGGTESPVTINGLPIYAYSLNDPQLDYEPGDSYVSEDDNIVVPLFVAPTVDWEYADRASGIGSRVSVAQEGGCPWLEAGEQFRYYIAFFKVFGDGSPAKLIGTACPECGSLNP